MDKIWAHSGDSHFLEPEDLWRQILPPKAAERMPRSEKVSDDEEIVHVDGTSFRRKLPKIMTKRTETGETIGEMSARPPGARDVNGVLWSTWTARASGARSSTRRSVCGSG